MFQLNNMGIRFTKLKERLIEILLLFIALISVASLFLIFFFVAQRGIPFIFKVGLKEFLFGFNWLPSQESYGILPLLMGSIIVTFFALILGGILGLLSAVFFSEIASKPMRNIMRPVLELLAAIPSVVYGFIGILVVIPLVNKIDGLFYSGFGIFSASLILGIMIIPTIATIAEDSLRSVPKEFREASYALGSTRWQTIYRVVIPASKSGILAAIILGTGRAIGETMAVLMVIGNPAIFPKSIFSPAASMTSIIAMDMSYASGDHRSGLFAVGVVLFVLVMIIISIAYRFGVQKR